MQCFKGRLHERKKCCGSDKVGKARQKYEWLRRYLGRSSFTRSVKKGSIAMVLFRYGTDKNRFGTHFFLLLQCVNARPLFGTVLLHFSCPSACGIVSAVSVSLAVSVLASKKQLVNALLPVP